jgi:hypothetical protein
MRTVMTPGVTALAAATTAGVALWLSRASFDVAGTTAATERVAMLPSLAELTGLVVLALLIAAGIAAVNGTRKSRGASFWEGAGDALVPLFALSLLALPYLPLVADWIPALRALAGPARFVLWTVVVGQVLWILIPRINPSTSGLVFACLAVFLSAPFVMNVRAAFAILGDLLTTIRHLPLANWPALPAGSLGALFDQEYGILAYAPVLALGFVGLAGMASQPSQRRVAIPLILLAALLVVLPGTVDPWWSKSMLPGRPLFLLLPLLVAPIAWLYARLPDRSYSRAGAQVLLLVSVSITLIMVIFNDRVAARQEGDGASALLVWMSPAWQLWTELPTYIADSAAAATARLLLWLAVFGVVSMLVWKRTAASDGYAALRATTGVTVLSIAVVSTTAAVMTDEKRFDVEGRVLFPLLETFDPVARPIAVRYNAISLVRPAELPPLFTLSAVPGGRTDPQPVRVVLNARFRLPAGEYVLDLKGSKEAAALDKGSISLQVGREGHPVQAWPITGLASGHLQQKFELPLDAEFVGFRALRQVERGIAELRVTPVSVVETRRRLRTPTVLAAAAYPPATMFFHDSNVYTEPEGFWVKGRATARMTVRRTSQSAVELPLAIHSGGRPNVVTLSTANWSQTLELVPGVTERVAVPVADTAFLQLTISTRGGFVPAEIEQSRDRRLLGAWVAFIPDDISRTSAAP